MLHTHPLSKLSASIGLIFLLCAACQPAPDTAEAEPPASTVDMDVLDKALAAHGGLDLWQSFGSLEYNIVKGEREEHHLIDLNNRKILHTGDGYIFGNNGQDVWVAPALDAYPGNPRFASGLDFYFFAIPFVLADPGSNREYLGQTTVNGESYETIKITFDAGTGASSNDYYIAHFDPTSYQLKFLLYTVTFMSQTANEQYYARAYDTWAAVDGLLLPTQMTSYAWDSETRTTGETYREAKFSDITLSTAQPSLDAFARPAEAEIAQPTTP
ncbi:MAG: DUF6503 family protein [Bacteroidota bacterium]